MILKNRAEVKELMIKSNLLALFSVSKNTNPHFIVIFMLNKKLENIDNL